MYQSSPEKRKQMQNQGRIMEDITCIIDCGNMGSLFLGNIESANDISLLKKHRITSILSVCVSKISYAVSSQMKHYEHFILDDCENENIYRYFNPSFQFIEKTRLSGNVLVHCMAGISRSASIIAAYLMKKHNITSKQALQQLQRKRWQVYPNDGFVKQLLQYEKELNKRQEEIPIDWNGKIIKTSISDTSVTQIHKSNDSESVQNEYQKIRKKYIDNEKQLDLLQKSTQYSLQQQRKTHFDILNNGIDQQIKRLQQYSDSKIMLNTIESRLAINTENQQKKQKQMDTINTLSKNSTVNKGIQLDSMIQAPKKQEFLSKYQPVTTRDQTLANDYMLTNNSQQKLDNLFNQFGGKSKYQYK
ncbi:unnamed protein product [Paramecium pentaurelia]|uniref:protein-tyrosine-phosphatase n=1 Tax=Paramecium pentaurelia TaxID=43138 RepID=A0A8S1T8Y7_9CILI|nr:unnamed protein product [Paramecium pentaurelia]